MRRQILSVGALHKKGAYFYVIDAFVASILITGALIYYFSQYTSQTQSSQAYYSAEDFLSTLQSTQIRNYDDPTIRGWIANGTITDPRRSMLEQLALFETIGDAGDSSKLATIAAANTPTTISVQIYINGALRYTNQVRQQSDATTLLSAKRIVLLRQSPTDVYPPAIVEVRTWQ